MESYGHDDEKGVLLVAMSFSVELDGCISKITFNIYTSDIPITAHVNLAMYADDACIYSRSLNARVIDRRLQAALDTLRDWYAKWRIAVHPQKSTAVLFAIGGRRRRKFGNAPDLTFQGGIIPWQREVTYLGVALDSRVNWAAHIHRVLDRGPKMFGTLYPMMAGGGRLDASLKIQVNDENGYPVMAKSKPNRNDSYQ
ncbi:hypothetical protein Trydic_g18328 [Trypoxylus dichotomus]